VIALTSASCLRRRLRRAAGADKMRFMRPWPLLLALALACDPPYQINAPVAAAQAPVGAAERLRVSLCGQSIVAHAEVVRVGWSRYRGRAALTVALASPNDDVVDAYYAGGQGCELLALVGRGPLDADVQPGAPLRGLHDARRAARDGVVTSWALERHAERDGRWTYRFEIDAEGRMHTVFIDALGTPETLDHVQRRGGAGGGGGGGAAVGGDDGASGAAPGETTALGAAMIKLPRWPASR
jgi:hypothetical protein